MMGARDVRGWTRWDRLLRIEDGRDIAGIEVAQYELM